MTAAEHLARAVELADRADIAYRASLDVDEYNDEELRDWLRRAEVLAQMAAARAALHQEVWMVEGDPIPLLPASGSGATSDLGRFRATRLHPAGGRTDPTPLARFKKKEAPPVATGGADDPTPEEEES